MSDTVPELRRIAGPETADESARIRQLMLDAADELERLRRIADVHVLSTVHSIQTGAAPTRRLIRSMVMDDIWAETVRQDDKWGADRDQHHLTWLAILTEETGEVAQAVLQSMTHEPKGLRDARNELVQVAAVAVQFIEALDRAIRGE